MASNTYGRFYDNREFIISNMDLEEFDQYDRLPKETMSHPPLKMTILKCESDHFPGNTIANFCEPECFESVHPELTKNYLQALQGNLPGWKMAAVKINAEIFQIYFATDRPSFIGKDGYEAGIYNYIDIYGDGELEVLFEMDYHDGLPPICHKVSYVNHYESEHGIVVKVTKMIGQHKMHRIEMREDDFNQYGKRGFYCRVTEY